MVFTCWNLLKSKGVAKANFSRFELGLKSFAVVVNGPKEEQQSSFFPLSFWEISVLWTAPFCQSILPNFHLSIRKFEPNNICSARCSFETTTVHRMLINCWDLKDRHNSFHSENRTVGKTRGILVYLFQSSHKLKVLSRANISAVCCTSHEDNWWSARVSPVDTN